MVDIFELLEARQSKKALALLRRDPAVRTRKNQRGSTVLMGATFHGLPDVVELLLETGVDCNETRADGYSALLFAAFQGHARIVQRLLRAGANVDARTKAGESAFSLAIAHDHAGIAALLVRAGADPNKKSGGLAPLDEAQRHQMSSLVSLLIANGAKWSKPLFDKALDDGNAELVLTLVEHGADAKRAATWAARNNLTNVIEWLAAHGIKVPPPKGPPRELLSYEQTAAFLKQRGLAAKVKRWWPSGFGDRCAILYRGDIRFPSLHLDHDGPSDGKGSLQIGAGIIVDGDLTVDRVIENGEQDFGPFLVTTGDLTAANVAVAGATIFVGGKLRVRGAFHGYYNHGMTIVEGDVDAKLFIADDYFASFGGKVRGQILRSMGSVKSKVKLPREPKLDQVLARGFYKLEDGELVLRSQAIYKALAKSKPVAKR